MTDSGRGIGGGGGEARRVFYLQEKNFPSNFRKNISPQLEKNKFIGKIFFKPFMSIEYEIMEKYFLALNKHNLYMR